MDVEVGAFIIEVFSVELIHLLRKCIFPEVGIFLFQIDDPIIKIKVNILPDYALFGERIDMCAKPLQALRIFTDMKSIVPYKKVVIVNILANERLSVSRRITDKNLISVGNAKLLLIVGINKSNFFRLVRKLRRDQKGKNG